MVPPPLRWKILSIDDNPELVRLAEAVNGPLQGAGTDILAAKVAVHIFNERDEPGASCGVRKKLAGYFSDRLRVIKETASLRRPDSNTPYPARKNYYYELESEMAKLRGMPQRILRGITDKEHLANQARIRNVERRYWGKDWDDEEEEEDDGEDGEPARDASPKHPISID